MTPRNEADLEAELLRRYQEGADLGYRASRFYQRFTPIVRYVPVNQKIATGQIVVRAKGYVRYRLEIAPEMLEARVSGHFNASGGSGNDIQAVIATEDEFTNWINGHAAHAFYSTQGKTTTDTFDVRLAPGTYVLAFSNTFSAVSSKDVFLEVDLNYQRMETY